MPKKYELYYSVMVEVQPEEEAGNPNDLFVRDEDYTQLETEHEKVKQENQRLKDWAVAIVEWEDGLEKTLAKLEDADFPSINSFLSWWSRRPKWREVFLEVKVLQVTKERDAMDAMVELLKMQLANAEQLGAQARNRLKKLREQCGYIENGTSVGILISQDDATKTWIASRTDHSSLSHGDTFEEMLDKLPNEEWGD